MSDMIRVLRIVEYIGDRDVVERTLNKSIHGIKTVNRDLTIIATTIGGFPEIMKDGFDIDAELLSRKTNTELKYLKELVEDALEEKL